MTETREIGVGLISVGWMGKLHTRAYQAMPSVYPELGLKCRLVIAADTAPDRVEYAKDVLGYERGTTDYREVLADPDVDVVSICAPNMLHREIGIAAAKAGKPFWIEKPVGRDARETAEVAAAAREAGVATSIGYNYRHAPAIERMRELIADGTLGRITNIRSVFLNGYASEPKGALSWRFQKEFSGSGAMGDLLSPRRRPGAVRRRPDRRGHRPLDDHPRRAARSCPWARAPTSRSSRTARWAPWRTRTTPPCSPGSPRTPAAPARSAPWSAPGWSSGRSAGCRSRSTAPRARPPGTSSG